jgi:outer membrane receptor protein involved in Fe transport
VGGGLRYQSATIIGYPPGGDPAGPPPYNPDLSKPYRGPSETYVDLWIGYHRNLTNKINWNIQLNVENVGKKDSLLPVSLQGPINGVASPANYRIAPSQIVTLTNRFEF